MRGLRVTEGKKYKNDLDTFDGFVYDTSHVIGSYVIKHYLNKRRKLTRLLMGLSVKTSKKRGSMDILNIGDTSSAPF